MNDLDELIGKFVKNKKFPSSNKQKLKLGGKGDKGDKGKDVEIRADKLGVDCKDPEEMDDTIANFRKKLKRPKRVGGQMVIVGSSSVRDTELSGQVSDGHMEDVRVPASEVMETHKVVADNGFDMTMSVNEELQVKTEGKSKKFKRDKIPKKLKVEAKLDEGSIPIRGGGIFGDGGVSKHSSEEALENSPSLEVLKAHSEPKRKSRTSQRVQSKTVGQTRDKIEKNPILKDVEDHSHPVSIKKSNYAFGSDSKLVNGNLKLMDKTHSVPSKSSMSLPAVESEAEIQNINVISRDSHPIQNTLSCDTDQVTDQEIPEFNSIHASVYHSGLVSCSNKINFFENDAYIRTDGIQKVPKSYACVSEMKQGNERMAEEFTTVECDQPTQHAEHHTFCSIKVEDIDKLNILTHSSVNPQNQTDSMLNEEAATSGGTIYVNSTVDEEGNGASSPLISPDEIEIYPEEEKSLLETRIKNNKVSDTQRAARKSKKRRHLDMAYEGEFDWEVLLHKHDFDIVVESDSGGAAAVSAGLKARATGPVEKIKFKEVLKRKGGLQEYLECSKDVFRNHILNLWSKVVCRILPLVDCGVTNVSSENEPPRASLIREIYAFLDRNGYINFGVASEKNNAESSKPVQEKNFMQGCAATIVDAEDGVSFIMGQAKSHAYPKEQKPDVSYDERKQESEATQGSMLLNQKSVELSAFTEGEDCSADVNEENGIDGSLHNKSANLDLLNTDSRSKISDDKAECLSNPDPMVDTDSVQAIITDCLVGNDYTQLDFGTGGRVIVVGAGPAGLTAARHMQRQGYSVTVLEARSRIGGRVYTDRSSLSVPVDLGASIITGVEADVATERRADPSSLLCAQLGLDLSVLNSDCPLYDIVTGQKVPADLDEALEAEYNSLLDDMVLLVAEHGDRAMKMSLEDGLEYALEKRRNARSGLDHERVTSASKFSERDILSPLERRVMNWHFAHLEYGCAALLKEVSLPYWNQDDVYGGFGGAHCMIKGGYSKAIEPLTEGVCIKFNHVVTDISYAKMDSVVTDKRSSRVKVSTSNGEEFCADAVLVTVPLGCLKAETVRFTPPLPIWKQSSINRLGFGVLNKIAMEFQHVFWDESMDYFGATAEQTDHRGQCFMFWNVRKTVGAPVLIALLVGKAAIDGQDMNSFNHVNHAVKVLRKLFGETLVPDPVASVVTDWGRDPFSYGAYSYVAIGASGEDYDTLGRPVENCIFFAGEATCKEHPDTVGGAMMTGLREAVRIMDILSTGTDYTSEVESLEAAQRHTDIEMIEVRDIKKRLDAVELSRVLHKNSFDGTRILSRNALLQDLFFTASTTAGRLHLAKELLNLPPQVLKSFTGTKAGLTTLNLWILDSMGKGGTQLLRHCVRLLVLVSTNLLAVRMSGIGKTVKEKVCVHTSRDIRAIASQLVSVWIEIFRKEKASNGTIRLMRQSSAMESLKRRSSHAHILGKPPLGSHLGSQDSKGTFQRVNGKPVKTETMFDARSDINSSKSEGSPNTLDVRERGDNNIVLSEEEQAAIVAAEAARAAALAAAEAYASSEAKCNTSLQLPKIPSFHKFARREQYVQEEPDHRRNRPGSSMARQDCISEIDSRNCRVRDWSVDFSATCANIESSRMSVDNLSQRSHSNEMMNIREHSGESVAINSNLLTKAWVDSAGSEGIKDFDAIDRWQSQAAAADADYLYQSMHIRDEEGSNTSKYHSWTLDGMVNESSVSQVTMNNHLLETQPRGAERIKSSVVAYGTSLLMPLYKAKKIDKEGYKSILKKTATRVMEQVTDAEKAMSVSEFLDSKRKNKIRSFVDKLIERHIAMKHVRKD